jgi:hypothetical protein
MWRSAEPIDLERLGPLRARLGPNPWVRPGRCKSASRYWPLKAWGVPSHVTAVRLANLDLPLRDLRKNFLDQVRIH